MPDGWSWPVAAAHRLGALLTPHRAQYAGADPFAGDVWQVALLDLPVNASRRWPATQGEIDFGVIEPAWLREIVKDWARSTRPYLQRLRETLRACQAASHALITAGPAGPASLGAGDFTRILDAISAQRRTDGDLYSANHRNLMIYQFCQVIEHGRASGLMSAVPDPFRPATRHRVREDPNEDGLGKALPETVIRQLDASLHLLGPAGRAGAIAAADLQRMHQVIYQILRDTGRRPGEVVSLRAGCVEVTGGQHSLIYDNHKAGRMRRRLPITAATAGIILSWQRHRASLRVPPALNRWLFPSPLLRARQSRGHITPSCVARGFKAWTRQIGVIDSELPGPGGAPGPGSSESMTPIWRVQALDPRATQDGVMCPRDWRARSSGLGNSHRFRAGGTRSEARCRCQDKMIPAVAAVIGSRRRIRPALWLS